MSDKSTELTAADIALLQEYLQAIEEIHKRIPERLPAEVWDEVMSEIQATGKVPAKYSDRIGESAVFKVGGQPSKGYYDIKWENWHSECNQIDHKYHDVILKAVKVTILKGMLPDDEEPTILDLLQQLIAENRAELPAVIIRKLEKIDFPIDKVNKDIWRILDTPGNGQLTMGRYNVAKKGSVKPLDVLYSLDFNGLKDVTITRQLEPYDKRVYLAVAALFNAGNDVISITQIYNAMGYSGRVGTNDIKKINAAITKMSGARLYIDNLQEAAAYKRRKHFKYDGALLPMERIEAIVNGQIAEAAIHIFREPPMVSFARERKQITTVAVKLLDTPISKTNANIELEDYLIEQIAHIKKGKVSNKMTYEGIYRNANITQKKQRQRAPEKVRKLLDHYRQCGYIKAYKEESDGVRIEY